MKPIRSILCGFLFIVSSVSALGNSIWDEQNTESYIEGCTSTFTEEARKEYFAQLEVGKTQQTRTKSFPEGKVRDAFMPMCVCLSDKIKTYKIPVSPDRANNINDPLVSTIVIRAIAYEECKTDGDVKKILSED